MLSGAALGASTDPHRREQARLALYFLSAHPVAPSMPASSAGTRPALVLWKTPRVAFGRLRMAGDRAASTVGTV
jgi:hypothetical protein